jgi:hypothetical protein
MYSLESHPTIIATWIGRTNKKCVNDYKREQVLLDATDSYPSWDDTKNNKLHVGDFFAWIPSFTSESISTWDETMSLSKLVKDPTPMIYIHKVIGVFLASERKKEWSSMGYTNGSKYKTSDRNRIVLSREYHVVSWNDYFPKVGYRGTHLQCTQPLKIDQSLIDACNRFST